MWILQEGIWIYFSNIIESSKCNQCYQGSTTGLDIILINDKLKKQLHQLEKQLNLLQLDKKSVCIVGSFVLALKNIRQNRDLDLVISPVLKKKISKKKKAFKITKTIEIVGDNWASTIRVDDESIVNDSRFYNLVNGFKIVKPEILFVLFFFI